MGKSNGDMQAALKKSRSQEPKPQIVESVPESHNQRSPSRRGKKMVACYLDLDAYRQLKILCAETDQNIEQVLKSGMNAEFVAHNKPPIA